MKLYVSAHSLEEAHKVAGLLREAGHEVVSTWHDADPNRFVGDRREMATTNAREIAEAAAVVLLAAPRRVPGGKFVEAGVAIGQGKRVFVLGHRENILLWHPQVTVHASVEALVEKLPK